MAHIEYTGILDEDARGAAAVNSIWSQFTTVSGALDYTNFADEGLDGRNIAVNQHKDGRCDVGYVGAGAAPVLNTPPFSNASTTFTVGAVIHHLDNSAATWAVGQGVGTVRVTFGMTWQHAFAANPGPDLTWRLQYKLDGAATWSDVPKSLRRRKNYRQIATNTAGAINLGNWYESARYTFDIPYPLDAASHVLNDVRVVVADDSGGAAVITFVKTFFRAVRIRKSVA